MISIATTKARPPSSRQSTGNPHGCSLLGGLLVAVLTVLGPGCASRPATLEVKVPVYVSCVKEVPVRPTFASPSLPGDASEGEKVLALARDTLLHFKYEGQLVAIITGCM